MQALLELTPVYLRTAWSRVRGGRPSPTRAELAKGREKPTPDPLLTLPGNGSGRSGAWSDLVSSMGPEKRTGAVQKPGAHQGAAIGSANFQSILMLAARITLPHFSVSSPMSFPKSAEEPPSVVAPKSARRAFTLRSARLALIALLSFPMISEDVFLGAPRRSTRWPRNQARIRPPSAGPAAPPSV